MKALSIFTNMQAGLDLRCLHERIMAKAIFLTGA